MNGLHEGNHAVGLSRACEYGVWSNKILGNGIGVVFLGAGLPFDRRKILLLCFQWNKYV